MNKPIFKPGVAYIVKWPTDGSVTFQGASILPGVEHEFCIQSVSLYRGQWDGNFLHSGKLSAAQTGVNRYHFREEVLEQVIVRRTIYKTREELEEIDRNNRRKAEGG